jgi:hypothetical protein
MLLLDFGLCRHQNTMIFSVITTLVLHFSNVILTQNKEYGNHKLVWNLLCFLHFTLLNSLVSFLLLVNKRRNQQWDDNGVTTKLHQQQQHQPQRNTTVIHRKNCTVSARCSYWRCIFTCTHKFDNSTNHNNGQRWWWLGTTTTRTRWKAQLEE